MVSDAALLSPDATRAASARETFGRLAARMIGQLQSGEVLFCTIRGEDSDFVRLNHGEVRQAGSVMQRHFSLHLIRGARHVTGRVTLAGEEADDVQRLETALRGLRERIALLPEDPYLLYATDAGERETHASSDLPDPGAALDKIRAASGDRDLVGIYASGAIYVGLVSSLGQSYWYDTRNFNFDWSFYHAGDKAVKTAYAGFSWDDEAFERKVDLASRQLEALKRPARTVPPGPYRAYLAPAALSDVFSLLSWGGFGLKMLKTRQSPLMRLASGEAAMHESVRLVENTAEGIAPDFQEDGFLKPATVPLIQSGRLAETLVSPRSAKEYGVPTNGASAAETPEAMDLGAGDLPHDDVLAKLGTGVWIGNVWYLNYSDRAACRTTGMTRFATFWVEDGEIVAPLNVMRFDDTVYDMLGKNLDGLTQDRELILEPGTYFQREAASGHFPGALVNDFRFTL